MSLFNDRCEKVKAELNSLVEEGEITVDEMWQMYDAWYETEIDAAYERQKDFAMEEAMLREANNDY